jgi:RNA recognition motif-containing protein
MLCKSHTEEDVKTMFLTYGTVEDVSILRNAEGRSKGEGVEEGMVLVGLEEVVD